MKKVAVSLITLLFLLTLLPLDVSAQRGRDVGRRGERPATSPAIPQDVEGTRRLAFVGTVTAINETTDSFTLSTKRGVKTVRTTDQTVFQEEGSLTTLASLSISDLVGVVGRTSEANPNEITALRVFIAPQNAPESRRHAVYGIVSQKEATGAGTLLTLSHPKRTKTFEVLLTSDTKVTKKGMKDATADDISINDRVVAVGTPSEDGVLVAKRAHVIPGLGRGLFETGKPATPP